MLRARRLHGIRRKPWVPKFNWELPFLWSVQREIYSSVKKNPRTVVPAAHSTGKSYFLANLMADWILDPLHPRDKTRVVVIAPTYAQIRAGSFTYLKRLKIPGKVSENGIPTWKIRGTTVAEGVSPKPGDSVGQGWHDPYLLVLLEEANGILAEVWTKGMSLASLPKNRVLGVGNPTAPETPFEYACKDDTWNKIHLPASKLPCFSGEYIPEALKDHFPTKESLELMASGWNAAERASRIDAIFPTVGMLSIFDIEKDFTIDDSNADPPKSDMYGMDVAGAGADFNRLYGYNREKKVAWEVPTPASFATEADPAQIALTAHTSTDSGVPFNVDGLGPGATVVAPLQLLRPTVTVSAILTNGEPAVDPQYFNLRSEMHWDAKHEGITLLRPSEELKGDIKSIRQDLNERRRKAERKRDVKQRTGRSPDDLDSFLLAAKQQVSTQILVV